MKKNKKQNSGYVALIGRTNAGKSTFLNTILERKIAIVSSTPQTTRRRILGIHTTAKGQIVFFDLPGVHQPHFQLNERMMKDVHEGLREADVVLYFIDVNDRGVDHVLIDMLKEQPKPVFLIINKIDKFSKSKILGVIDFYKDVLPWREIVPISALKGDNIDLLEKLLFDYLPAGESLFPDDQFTNQTEAYYVAEIVREKLLRLMRDELPFSIYVETEEKKDRGDILYIRANIHVETASQKKIVVGKQGRILKETGEKARIELEEYFSKRVFLDLYAKVTPDWRNSPLVIKDMFG